MDYILCHALIISWVLNELYEGIRALAKFNPSILPSTNETYSGKLIWNAIISSNHIIFTLCLKMRVASGKKVLQKLELKFYAVQNLLEEIKIVIFAIIMQSYSWDMGSMRTHKIQSKLKFLVSYEKNVKCKRSEYMHFKILLRKYFHLLFYIYIGFKRIFFIGLTSVHFKLVEVMGKKFWCIFRSKRSIQLRLRENG